MSVDQLWFSEGGIRWFKIQIDDAKFKISLVDGTSFKLDRNQADLLRLWLEEHLK